MAPPRSVLDASVLYQEPLRSLLLWVAAEGGFEPLWTQRILAETGDNLLAAAVLDVTQWDRLLAAMSAAFSEASLDQAAVDAIEDQMPNHEKVRHVLAAAVIGDAEVIVTNNLRHFKADDLAPLAKRALDPDSFLCELLDRSPSTVALALDHQVAHMRRPRQWTLAELAGRLGGQGAGDPLAPAFAAALERELRLVAEPPPRRSG
jgi:hypothetical protein